MTVHLRTENIQTTISSLNSDFSGRVGTLDYDESKLIHIHRRNRPFVWSLKMQESLLDSILMGYYIPPIICSTTRGGIERREVMEGGNRITTFRKILNEEVRPLTEQERQRVNAHPITLVVMRNLTSKDQRIMFRRLNKNVKVTDGQLYSMSEDDSPLVKEAISFLNDEDYPLRDKITTHFFVPKEDNLRKSNLENAIAILSGAIYGVKHISKLYNAQEEVIESQEPIRREMIVHIIGSILEIFTMADQQQPLQDKRKLRGQWGVGKWVGAILYDYHTHQGETRSIQEKWANYIVAVRREEVGAEQASKLGGAQNLTETRYKKICTKVEIYLKEGRVATDEELATVVHNDSNDNGQEEEEEEEDFSDEREDL
jgi:hypothetical protein